MKTKHCCEDQCEDHYSKARLLYYPTFLQNKSWVYSKPVMDIL